MLLAGLQRQDEPPSILLVDGLPRDAPGHAPDEAVPRREETQGRSTETRLVAHGLPLSHGDVRAVGPRRFDDPEGDRVHGHDQEGTRAVHDPFQVAHGFQAAVEIGMLDDHAGRVVRQSRRQQVGIQRAVRAGQRLHLDARSVGVGMHRLYVMGVHASCEYHTVAPRGRPGQHGRFRRRRSAVVHGGVCHLQARQFADHRLELVDALERALAHFRLVRRVGGQEFRAAGQVADGAGYEVIVHAAAHEGCHPVGRTVAGGHLAHRIVEFEFRQGGR